MAILSPPVDTRNATAVAGQVKALLQLQTEYGLRLMSIPTDADLVDEGRNLVIVALVGDDLNIRFFDFHGNKVVDKAEKQLISGEKLTALKNRLTPVPDVSALTKEEKQKIIKDATFIAGYTLLPEWDQADRMGGALISVFSRFAEIVIERLNRVPEKNFVAFLDLLGASRLPPQPARVPLTFTLAEGATVDVAVPAGTQVSAEPSEGEAQPTLFETERDFVATSVRLQSLFIRDPQRDRYANHSAMLDAAWNGEATAFEGKQSIDHSFYIGHQALFGCTVIQNLHLTFDIKISANAPLLELGWQIWDGKNGIDLFSANNATSTSEVFLSPAPKGGDRLITQSELLTNTINFNGNSITVSDLVLLEGNGALIHNQNGTWTYTPAANDSATVRFRYLLNYANRDMVTGYASMGITSEENATDISRNVTVIFRLPPTFPEATVGSLTNRWLRCRMKTPIVAGIKLPIIESIHIRLDSIVHGLRLDAAAHNTQQLDVSKEFFPFGEKPKLGDCFYIAHREGFSRVGAKIILFFSVVDPKAYIQTEPGIRIIPPNRDQPVLIWEYWGGGGWQALLLDIDESKAFTSEGTLNRISFTVPIIKPVVIAGVDNLWVRVRITGGNYGKEGGLGPVINNNGELVIDSKDQIQYKQTASTLVPPQLASLTVEFIQEAAPEAIVTVNDFVHEAVEKKAPYSSEFNSFEPFRASLDNDPSIYLGFTLPAGRTTFPNRPLSLYFAIAKVEYQYITRSDGQKPDGPPQLVGEYWNGKDWITTTIRGETENLAQSGLVVWLPPTDIGKRTDFGMTDHYWLRIRLTSGGYLNVPRLQRVLLNTTLAAQAVSLTNEVLGSSNENQGQRFRSTQAPVLPGQQLEVEEAGFPAADELAIIMQEEGDDAVRTGADPTARKSAWVRWHEVPDFHGSGSRDRHYVLDRLNGEIRFGDGINGMVPPRGVGNIRMARYQCGGGQAGNKPAGTVINLQTTLPYIDSVTNFEAASGGADAEPQESVMERAPKRLRHHFRAVTMEDFEDLALLASPNVARSLCVPLLDIEKNPLAHIDTEAEEKTGTGHIGVIIVPRFDEPKALPHKALIDRVRDYLVKRAVATATISVAGPLYLSINVDMEVVLQAPEAAGKVEANLYQQLNAFLHPLTGGQEGSGWPFGEQPQESDVYRLISDISGIDHVSALKVSLGIQEEKQDGKDAVDKIRQTGRFLIYSGEHRITLK